MVLKIEGTHIFGVIAILVQPVKLMSNIGSQWCGIIGSLLIGPYIFSGRLTGNGYLHFPKNKLPQLLEDVE